MLAFIAAVAPRAGGGGLKYWLTEETEKQVCVALLAEGVD